MEHILITGKNSFVGKQFIEHTSSKYTTEFCLLQNAPSDIDFEGVDTVFHVAAIVHQTKQIPDEEYFKVNRDLCLDVAKRAKSAGVKQFVFLSTVKVYGDYPRNGEHWDEETECHPMDGYGKSKYAAEIGLKELESENFVVSIVRTPLVYGPGVKANMLSIINLVRRFPVLPLGGIENKRNFTYVENLVGFIDRIIEKRASGVFIAMDEKPMSTTFLVKSIRKSLGKKRLLFKAPMPFRWGLKKTVPGIYDRLFGSFQLHNEKTKHILDYEPPVSSETGIDRTVKALLNKENTK